MPLIVMLMLICVIAITLVVGAPFGRPSETAELNKDVEQEEEHISAAVDIAATSIGTNAKATFTASTGEIHIYNSTTSGTATMSKSSWYTFLKKIITADGNLNAVKSITFDNEVYAPKDSSRLFYPSISDVNYPFSQLVNINESEKLRLDKVVNAREMFYECSSLVTFRSNGFGSESGTDISLVFAYCASLQSFESVGNKYKVTSAIAVFYRL